MIVEVEDNDRAVVGTQSALEEGGIVLRLLDQLGV